jgi:two-component system sensor histidine kinase/response regulator
LVVQIAKKVTSGENTRVMNASETPRAESLTLDLELFRFLLETTPDQVYFKDRQGRFIRVSRAVAEFLEVPSPEQVVGKTDFDLLAPDTAQAAADDERQIIESGQPLIGKVEKVVHPDGRVTWDYTTKLALKNSQGEIIGICGINKDFTAIKELENALTAARREAEEANRAKSQFLADMSHEIRTPLNSVIGFANVLLKNRSGNMTAADISFLERIAANGKHLLSLINNILDLAKVEAGKVELEITDVNLPKLVTEVAAQLEGQFQGRNVRLLTELPAGMTPIRADWTRLKQIIINLMANALKFTEHGSVTVVVVVDSKTQEPVRLDIIDTGIGIPEDKLEKVFQAFQQQDAATERKYGGTGLGLTITRSLCELMGYRIEVRSQVGVGSTFSVLFEPMQSA